LFEDFEINLVLVNDGSTQKIFPISTDISIEYIENTENQGKGFSIRKGLSHCLQSDIYLYTDVDIPYDTESMVQIIDSIRVGTDIALSRRDVDYVENTKFDRKITSLGLKWFIRNIIGLRNYDTQGGLKGFNEKGKNILLNTKINRYLFDLEWIKLAEKKGLIIQSIHVRLNPGVELGKMNWKIFYQELFNLIKIIFA